MKIALVAHEIHDYGGMERCMASLARWLKAHGETVHLYTADKHCPLADEGFVWRRIPAAKKPLGLRLYEFHHRSKTIIPWDEYDIIHANGGIIPHQTVTTIHFCQAAWLDVLQDPRFKQPYTGKGFWRYWNRLLSGRYAAYLERQAVHSSRLVVCVSRQAAFETEKYYQPAVSPKIVYNGVSLKEFSPPTDFKERNQLRQSLGAQPDDTVLLFVGGEFGRKGLSTILQSLQKLPDPRVKLWVCGRDPMLPQFKEMAAKLGVDQHVSFLGFFPDLPQLMQGADMFVFPSHYDSFGLVITEAMATGLPVITTQHAGASELIEDRVNGFLLRSPGDAEQLAERISQLRENPDLLRQMKDAALETVKHHTWDHMAEGFYTLYCELLGQPIEHALSSP